MKDKLSIPKFVSFASGRVTRIAKDATETNFNLSCKRNSHKMTDKTDINATPRIAEEASNKTLASPQNRYTMDYALEQIEKISSSTDYLDNAVNELRQMKTPDGVGDIANQAKAMAIADVVKYRETTNQQALRFYEKMYEDLKPKDYTVEKLNSLNSAIASVSAAPDINDAIDTVRQIFRENFAVAPKSNTVSRLDELAAWLKNQNRDEYDEHAWNSMLEAVKGQMSRNY